jgi:O-antigen/teichoic acid export membrane protein
MADRAMRAVAWSFVSSALGKLATIVIGVVLARMLSPREFGVYAVAYAALRILVSLNDLGLSLAIVRWPGDPGEIAPTVATIAALVSLVMYGGCYLGAPAYASAMGAPSAAQVVRVLCLGVVLDGFVSSPAGLLQRQFRQDLRLVTDQANLWLGTVVTIVLAWRGFGAMSLGVGRVAGCIVSLLLMVKFSPEPVRFGFSLARARDVARFGLPIAASTIIAFGVVNADQVVVGRMLGVTALGYFVLAANLSSWPVAVFAQPVRNVALAGFARLQHDPPAMRRAFLLVASLLTAVALPVCLMMSGAAVPLIGFVYGARWLHAAPVLAWLGVLAALQIGFELSYDYFVVLALPRVVFILQLVWLIALVPALAAGARAGGPSQVAQAEIGVAAGLVLPWYLWELRKAGIGAGELARRLRLPAAGAAAAGLACWAAGRLVADWLSALAAGAALGAGIIVLLIRHLRPRPVLLGRRPGRAGGMAPRGAPAQSPGQGFPAGAAAPGREPAVPGPGPLGPVPGASGGNGAAMPIAWHGGTPAVPYSRAHIRTTWLRPGYRDTGVVVPPPPEADGLPPLYRATASALGWAPQEPACRDGQDGRDPPPA